MEMSSSQREMVHEQRPVMSADLFSAAMKGDEDVLIQRLELPKERNEVMVIIEASDSAPEQINTEYQTVQSELQSATRFGDTVLHLLVTEGHNELALKVFQRDMSLLKAQNKMLETPLYCVAKVGNEEVIHNLIRIDPVIVKDALEKTNENGDTSLHVAAKHGHTNVGCELMKLDPEVAYKVNIEMLPPLYIAIDKGYTKMVQAMLEVDPTLACTKFSDGLFPVHVAARMGNKELVMHFMEKYPFYAELPDPRGRNLFHIAAEENRKGFFRDVLKNTSVGNTSVGEMIARMNNATDYERNTPLHIATMKGHKAIRRAILENSTCIPLHVRNNQGLTPSELFIMQMEEATKDIDETDDVKEPPLENKWERTQVIGLGSVLITTVTFAAAFTIPGGYNQDHGTPVLGRRYMFWAFILANALAFIQGFLSLFALLINALPDMSTDIPVDAFEFAAISFLLAASSMVVSFGLGMYVTLAPVCLPIAILLLVITLFVGSPALPLVFLTRARYIEMVTNLFTNLFSSKRTIVAAYIVPLVLIFCLALLYL